MSRKRQNTSQHATRQDPFPTTPSSSSTGFATFQRASTSTLKSRVIKSAVRTLPSLRTAHLQSLHGLNTSFVTSVRASLLTSPGLNVSQLANEYLAYLANLKQQYAPPATTTVLTFGTGDCGQLGFGIDEDPDLMVKKPRTLHSLSSATWIAAGGLHNIAVMTNGQVYSWGCNDDGGVGRDTSQKAVDAGTATPDYMPATVDFPKDTPVTGLGTAAGDCQSVLTDTEGRIWVWGSYKDKEGKPIRDAPTPAGVRGKNDSPYLVRTGLDEEGGVKAVSVCCGASFNAARTSDGKIITWGLGECGELARPVKPIKVGEEYDTKCIWEQHLKPAAPVFADVPNDLPSSRYVKSIGAGGYHLLVVTVSPTAGYQSWASGLNNYGQLGVGDHDNRDVLTPITAFSGMNILAMDGGMHHSAAIAADGTLFAFGRGDSGQLGVTDEMPDTGYCEESPVLVTVSNKEGRLNQLACGANHNLVVSTKNEVYSWGYGDMSALGHGKDEDVYRPKRMKFAIEGARLVHKIAGGGQHSSIILGSA